MTFSAISATRFAILEAMISKGEMPLTCGGTGGVFFAAVAVLETELGTGFLTAPLMRGGRPIVDGAFVEEIAAGILSVGSEKWI